MDFVWILLGYLLFVFSIVKNQTRHTGLSVEDRVSCVVKRGSLKG